ncbi:MAG: anthranilate synthase component I family protein [Candidatus Melainabacteria bacterium]|nr:anthranilate synthase component I family protein [Candidatus Melainabacteria bacterium]
MLHKVNLIVNVLSKDKNSIKSNYASGKEKLNSFITEFSKSKAYQQLPINYQDTLDAKYTSNYSEDDFIEMVKKAKEYITNGDIFQVVLSQKLILKKHFEGFMLYRALRSINPSPYLFYLNFLGYEIAGSSPEVMVKGEKIHSKKIASLRPIAGTYQRGLNDKEDKEQITNLLNDPKERAEHLMLVDLARNDLGRVCKAGSIQVPEFMIIEKYSHVLHIVSQVEGILEDNKTIMDLLSACFPAGTLSGAPKVRAMEIINSLEKDGRGPYGGCIGFYGLNDTINTCMTIRTFVIYKDYVEIQAGAGIVADSDPKNEYLETLRKGAALLKAISLLK